MKARIVDTDEIIDVKKIAGNKYSSKSHIYEYSELDFEDVEIQTNSTVNRVRKIIKEHFSNYNAGMNKEKQYAIVDFCNEVDDLLRKIKID